MQFLAKKILCLFGISEEKIKMKCQFFSVSGTISPRRRTSSTKQYSASGLMTLKFEFQVVGLDSCASLGLFATVGGDDMLKV